MLEVLAAQPRAQPFAERGEILVKDFCQAHGCVRTQLRPLFHLPDALDVVAPTLRYEPAPEPGDCRIPDNGVAQCAFSQALLGDIAAVVADIPDGRTRITQERADPLQLGLRFSYQPLEENRQNVLDAVRIEKRRLPVRAKVLPYAPSGDR